MNNHKLKIMIVDDEELARKFIVKSLDWAALNMEIIGEAVSGLEALNLMEEQTPDILFTDIKMPYMDGLELSRLVSRRYSHIKIVILTAFKDFDYAQKSIDIGVSHFILKPINKTDLLSTVMKLKSQIEEERHQWFEYDHLKKILSKNASFLRERFLLEFLEDSQQTPYSEKQLAYYYPQGVPGYIQVTLLETRSPGFLELTEEEHLLQDMKNKEFIENYLKNTDSIEVLADKDHHLILLSYSPQIEMTAICEQIQRAIYQTTGFELLFGIGFSYKSFYMLSLSCQEALEALKFSMYTPNQPISIYQNDLHVQNSGWSLSPGSIEDAKFYIKAGLPEQLTAFLPSLYLDENNVLIAVDYARILSMTLFSAGINVANDIGIPLEDLSIQGKYSFLPILLESTTAEIRSKTIAYLAKLASSIAAFRSSKSKNALWDIIQYIQKEMNNPELSLGAVAAAFHMNDSYLSRTFKKELGFSFSKYLNRLRMERAIFLITTTDMKAYQVGEAVGIPDAYYFSNCFKKYTGKSIREYKKGS